MNKKIKLNRNTYDFPMPITLLGTVVNSKINYMALAWITRINKKPPLIGISVDKPHSSHKGILENKTFSINYPNVDLLKETDYCGIYSAMKIDKSQMFETFNGELKNAPMIRNCTLNLECTVINLIELPINTFFIAEIINAYSEDKYMDNGKLNIKKMNPLLLTMPDNKYWNVGENVGLAWKDGKQLIT